jgi:hypothetical protein
MARSTRGACPTAVGAAVGWRPNERSSSRCLRLNGTLSHDEPILYAVYRDMFVEHGRPLSEADYYG